MASTFVCPCEKRNETTNIINSFFINILNLNKIMDKKELKFYDAPACEVVELKLQGMLCGSPNPDNPLDSSTADTEEME